MEHSQSVRFRGGWEGKVWRVLALGGLLISALMLSTGLSAVLAATTLEAPDPEGVSFNEEEVSFQNDEITLAGTLTLPETEGPHPAIVLISGSGPQDRDAGYPGLPGYLPNVFLAEHLAEHGVAALL